MSEITTINANAPRTIDNVSILTNGDLYNRLQNLASVMANSGEMVPAHYRGKPDACMATVMQAARWGMDPFAVAQKTHIVSGTLGYEAQLVNAVITTMAPTKDRIHYDWFGPWEKVIGKFQEKTSSKGNKYIAPAWTLADENGVGVKVWATLKGESDPRVLELYLSQAQVRNSTLWASDPRQQLAYLAVKRWSRLYCPDVILGVYSDDELEERIERDITPAAPRVEISALADSVAAPAAGAAAPENPASEQETAPAEPDLVQQLREGIEQITTVESATALRAKIEEHKATLGIAAFTELKGKAVKGYHRVNAMTNIEKRFDELSPDLADAKEKFATLEAAIAAAQRHLDPKEYERFATALDDMRAEYVA
ncbi:RecT family recombinase [Pantoea agglomerans]|uniref:RecT family recombinase n=1 Tax=Enterobacter agglomerans TaxID=549 RepID=UPI003FD018AE